jgi:GntR family transcriptional regulator
MSEIERANPLPLYAQVKAALQDEIERTMQPGDALPTEPELEQKYKVSRITVRRALDELASEGLILRQQGRGTFVREPGITQELPRLVSWSQQMRQAGYLPETFSTEVETIEAPHEVAAMLRLAHGAQVTRVRRLRGVSGEPVCVMVNYLPDGLLPDVEASGFVEDSLYATLAASGVRPVRAEDTVEARAATGWEAERLGISEGAPLLQVTRLTFDGDGKPLYVSVVSNRGDKYRYGVHVR